VEAVAEAGVLALLEAGPEGPPALLAALRSSARQDGGRAFRRAAALLAARLDGSTVERIARTLSASGGTLRVEAVRLLGAFASPLTIPALGMAAFDAHEEVVAEAVVALARLGPGATPALVSALEAGPPAARRAAARALGGSRAAAIVDALVRALGDRDAEVRRAAARSLGEHKDPASLEPLLGVLRDASAAVAQEAATAVGRIGDPRAVDRLLDAARGQTGAGANLAIIEALAALGDPRALDLLLPRLDHPDPQLVAAAATAIGSFADPRAVDALIVKLEHGHEAVRVAAARSLARIGNPLAAAALTFAKERATRRESERKEMEAALEKLERPGPR
jgi:HEAT repeat protein